MTVTAHFTQVINKLKHKKHIMIESCFEFTVSSKNKPILVASCHEFYFTGKDKFTVKTGFAQSIKQCRATAITENNKLIETRGEHNHDISAGNWRPEMS